MGGFWNGGRCRMEEHDVDDWWEYGWKKRRKRWNVDDDELRIEGKDMESCAPKAHVNQAAG